MELAEYDKQAALEDRFWWFVGMRAIYQRLLRPHVNGTGRALVLDIGCGVGNVRRCLPADTPIIGVDLSSRALAYCRSRGYAGLVQASGEALPFRDGCFSSIIALNIVEHIADDVAFLKELRRCCRPEGTVFLVTSACAALWSEHDEAVHHKRRYSRRELVDKLSRAGLRPLRLTYANTLLFPPVWVLRRYQAWRRGASRDHPPTSDVHPLPGPLNGVLTGLLRLESQLLRWGDLPFGISLACICERS